MYFRTEIIKGTPPVQLVESYRNAEGQPRQRVVASLGDADIPKVEKPLIASAVKRRLKGDSNWFEPELYAVASGWVARIVQLAGRSRGTRVFQQKEDRVDGHVFISVLAYHLLSWVRRRLEENGDRREWKTIRRILRTHSLVSTRLPLADGRVIIVRKPSVPDAEQAQILRILGVDWKALCPATKTEIKP